jgi:Mg/Co/Ni transporter MgtE
MALRWKKSHGDLESDGTQSELEFSEVQNRNAELETLVTSLKRMLDISRRREKKLIKALEDINADHLLSLDLDDCNEEKNQEQSFLRNLADRTIWLIGLLAFQSLSSYILRSNEALLQKYPTIVYFLTMLVGAGGNAGNQATVRVIRGLALGSLTVIGSGWYIMKEIGVAITIGVVLGIVGFIRVYFFSNVVWNESIAISIALVTIVVASIIIGVLLPLFFELIGIDSAHSSTTIQVLMDISGVLITCMVAGIILESPTI